MEGVPESSSSLSQEIKILATPIDSKNTSKILFIAFIDF
jgi:hypothetical protein